MFSFYIGKDYSSGKNIREPFSYAADKSRNLAIFINIIHALNFDSINSMSVNFLTHKKVQKHMNNILSILFLSIHLNSDSGLSAFTVHFPLCCFLLSFLNKLLSSLYVNTPPD